MTTKYKLTPEHEAQLKPWADKWIANAMSTAPMTDEDRAVCVEAVKGLYEAIDKPMPRVVFVSSPFVGRFAAGYASGLLHRKQTTDVPGDSGIEQAVRAAVNTPMGTVSVVSASDERTEPDSRYYRFNTKRAKGQTFGLGDYGIECTKLAYRLYQGGNQWSTYDCFLSFFRHVAKLDIDYSKWQHWEALALHSGPRFVHEQFVIICDRPSTLKVDDQNRPHAEKGPFCEWRDGSAIYAWHGTYVPSYFIEKGPNVEDALTHQNTEVRRATAEILGWKKVLDAMNPRVIDEDSPDIGTLLEVDLPDSPKSRFLKVRCGTGRDFVLSVPGDMKTALQANAWTYGLEPTGLKLEART